MARIVEVRIHLAHLAVRFNRGLRFLIAASVAIVCFIPVSNAQNDDDAYRVHPGDRLQVDVFKQQDVSGRSEVAADGTITLPLIRRVKAANLTLKQIETAIAEILSQQYSFRDPVVVARVAEYSPVFLAGWIRNPGRYPFTPGMTVRQAIALGGGVGPPHSDVADPQSQAQFEADRLLRSAKRARLHLIARLSRLTAEKENSATFEVPAELRDTKDPQVRLIVDGEKALFTTRQKNLAKTLEAMKHQQADLDEEIKVLRARESSINSAIKLYREELRGLKSLSEQGHVAKFRLMDIERGVQEQTAELHASTAEILRAKVARGNVARDIIRMTENAQEKIEEERLMALRELDQTEATIATIQAKFAGLENALVDPAATAEPALPAFLTFIHRREARREVTLPADESAELQPSDTLEILLSNIKGGATAPQHEKAADENIQRPNAN